MKLFLVVIALSVVPVVAGAQTTVPATFAEAAVVRQRFGELLQQGEAEQAWELELSLVDFALANTGDVRSAWILRDVAARRMDILAKYDAGEYPPEVVYGCYYYGTQGGGETRRLSSQPVSGGSSVDVSSCAAGSRRRMRHAIAEEARLLYAESAAILLNIDEVTTAEIRDVVIALVATSYQTLNYRIGLQGLTSLLARQERDGDSALEQARTVVLIGDWDLLFAEHFGTRYIGSAEASYEKAIALLRDRGIAGDAVDSLFAVPVLLPTFYPNGFTLGSPDAAGQFIDVGFEIRKNGRSARIDVLDASAELPRAAEREAVDQIKHGRFRPLAADGQLLDSAPVTARYYIRD